MDIRSQFSEFRLTDPTAIVTSAQATLAQNSKPLSGESNNDTAALPKNEYSELFDDDNLNADECVAMIIANLKKKCGIIPSHLQSSNLLDVSGIRGISSDSPLNPSNTDSMGITTFSNTSNTDTMGMATFSNTSNTDSMGMATFSTSSYFQYFQNTLFVIIIFLAVSSDSPQQKLNKCHDVSSELNDEIQCDQHISECKCSLFMLIPHTQFCIFFFSNLCLLIVSAFQSKLKVAKCEDTLHISVKCRNAYKHILPVKEYRKGRLRRVVAKGWTSNLSTIVYRVVCGGKLRMSVKMTYIVRDLALDAKC